MSTQATLPVEIWTLIITDLPTQSLAKLSETCSVMCQICEPCLAQRRDVLKRASRFILTGKYHASSFPYHRLLLDILRGDILPAFVEEFICDNRGSHLQKDHCRYLPRRSKWKPRISKCDLGMIRQMVRKSPWIPENEEEGIVSAIEEGSEPAVFALILPMMKNLKHLQFPLSDDGTVARILSRVAQAQERTMLRHKVPDDRATSLSEVPLSQLVLLSTAAYNSNEECVEVAQISPYLRLRSVRRMVFCSVYFTSICGQWPLHIPLCSVPEIYFSASSVSLDAVKHLSLYFAGPCSMRQLRDPKDHHRNMVEWDHFELGTSETVKLALRGSHEIRYPQVHSETYQPAPRRGSDCSDKMRMLLDDMTDELKSLEA